MSSDQSDPLSQTNEGDTQLIDQLCNRDESSTSEAADRPHQFTVDDGYQSTVDDGHQPTSGEDHRLTPGPSLAEVIGSGWRYPSD